MNESSTRVRSKDYIWNTVGVFAQNVTSLLLLIIVTRINGIFDSGIFSFAFSVATIFWVVSMWGGRTYQVSDVNREFSHLSYVMVRIILAIVVAVAAVLFVLVNGYDFYKSGIIISLVILKIFESIADALYGVLQVNNKLHIAGMSLTYKTLAGIIIFIIIDLATKDVLMSTLGVVAANIIVIIFYDLPLAKGVTRNLGNSTKISEIVRNSFSIMNKTWPVLAVMLLSMFSLNIPRYFIDKYHNEEIGYFGIIAMLITIVVLFMWFILQPNIVKLSTLYAEKNLPEFNKSIRRIIISTVLGGLMILTTTIVAGVSMLQFVFGIDFSQYRLALVVVVVGGIINAIVTVFIYVLVIMRSLRPQLYILLITNIILFIVSPIIVSGYGLNGSMILFVIVNMIQLVLLTNLVLSLAKKYK